MAMLILSAGKRRRDLGRFKGTRVAFKDMNAKGLAVLLRHVPGKK